MYGNRAVMEVQRRNNFVVGSDNTEIITWGRGVCWGHGGIKLNNTAGHPGSSEVPCNL